MKNLNFLRFATRLTLLLVVVVSLGLNANAQVTVPDGFQYQAIARDASGVPMAEAAIAVRFTVDADNAAPATQEFLNVNTNDFGLFNLVVGAGVDFDGLVNPTVKIEIDLGDGYVDMGTVPFQSVPYAAVAGNVAYVEAGVLHVGDDSFDVGNFFSGTPGVVEPLQAVVVDANKSIVGFNGVGIDGELNIGGSVTTGQESIVFINNQDQNNLDLTSGALRVKGGVGIAKDVYIGGQIKVAGDIQNLGNLTTNVISATDIFANTLTVDNVTASSVTADEAYFGDLEATNIIATDIHADDFYGNFHGGTLDLGGSKSLTVNDILDVVEDNNEALVTAQAVLNADLALEEALMVNINKNASDIASNLVLIGENTTAIEANDIDIASNLVLIGENADAIATNASDIASNYGLITSNADDIASTWTFIDEDLDLQHVYDNGNAIITADNTPVDVTATTGVTVQGTNANFVGQLAGDNAAIYGTDGTNWGAIAYNDGSKGSYAGYFSGDVELTNNLTVGNTAHIDSEATAVNSTSAALVVKGGVGIGDNLIVANDITGKNILAKGDLTVNQNSYLEKSATIGTTDADMLTVNATAIFNAPVTIEELFTVNNDAVVNGTLSASDVEVAGDLTVGGTTDVQEFTLDGQYGTASDLMISNGPDTNPSWISVANLMHDLEDGDGIVNFTYDGSAPAVVTADVDMATVEFDMDSKIAVNEDHLFTWTASHVFQSDVTVDGTIQTANIESHQGDVVTIDDDLKVTGDGEIAGNLDVTKDITASSVTANYVETNDLKINNEIVFDSETIVALTNSAEVAGDYPLAGDDNLPTSGAVTYAVDRAIEERIDVLFFQELYDNARINGTDDDRHIVANDGPLQIYSDHIHGGLDVVATGSEIGIDARLNGSTATEHTTIQAILDGDYTAQLAASDGNNTAAVYGIINGNGVYGALGATIFNGTTYNDYAGYFNGNVFVKSNFVVSESGLAYINNTIGSGDANSGALVVKGGVGIGEILNVAADINGGKDLSIAASTSLGTSPTSDLLTVNAISTFNGEVTLNEALILDLNPGTSSDLMISQGAGTNPVWTSVADLMANLTNGLGIEPLDYDGSAPDVVTVALDDETLIFDSSSDIMVNPAHLFTWTASHVFQSDVNVDGDVTVGGVLYACDIECSTGSDVTVNDNLIVNGGLTVSDVVTFNDLVVNGTFHAQDAATMSSTLDVTGDATFGGTMGIAGNTTVGGTFHAQGAATMSDALTVDGPTIINNTLNVSSDVILGSSCANTLVVNAEADFNCLVTASALTVDHDVAIGGALHVQGAVTMSDALAVDKDLTVLGDNITLGSGSDVSLLTVNASSVFNGPVDINGILAVDGLELDGVVLTTVRTDLEGIRPYPTAEDTELVTEKAVASWLPDNKGAAQESRALVLDSAGEIDTDGLSGSGFTMDMGDGTLGVGTINGSTINATGTTETSILSVLTTSTFNGNAEFKANVSFTGNNVTFNQNPDLSSIPVTTGTTLPSAAASSIYYVSIASAALPASVADRIITIVNTSGAALALNIGGTPEPNLPIGAARQYIGDGSTWYRIQ